MRAPRPSRLPAEILDSLPADDPAARSSRKDLRRFNRALGNWAWIERTVLKHLRPGDRVLELGAGDGELGRRMGQRGIAWDGVDLGPRPEKWPLGAAWYQEDLRTFEPSPAHAIVVGNLVFHHFDDDTLKQIGARLRRKARVCVAGELRRSRVHEWTFGVYAWWVRAHRVSRHDGRLSIRAGFREDELPRVLGLESREWRWDLRSNIRGAYRMAAWRTS
jgi:hypothetical protein